MPSTGTVYVPFTERVPARVYLRVSVAVRSCFKGAERGLCERKKEKLALSLRSEAKTLPRLSMVYRRWVQSTAPDLTVKNGYQYVPD